MAAGRLVGGGLILGRSFAKGLEEVAILVF